MAATTYTITWSEKGEQSITNTFQCADNVYLLDAAEEAGFEWPYSGRSGTDSTSTAHLVSGTLDQHDQAFLSDEQTVEGIYLDGSCVPALGLRYCYCGGGGVAQFVRGFW